MPPRRLRPPSRPSRARTSGAPPAQRQADEHDHEQADVQHDLQADREVREIRVAAQQQDVGRAAVASELMRTGEQHRRDRGHGEDQVARDHQRAVAPGRQPARREAHGQVQEHPAPKSPDHEGQ
jgi:hypothetical protein